MFSIIGSNIIFNIIEYFSLINVLLMVLLITLLLHYTLIHTTLLYNSLVQFDHSTIEFAITLFSLSFIVLMISPSLIILLDVDLIIIPSYIIYSLGLQWAWQFNLVFIPLDIVGYESYCDHYILGNIMKSSMLLPYPPFVHAFNPTLNSLLSHSLPSMLNMFSGALIAMLYINKTLIAQYIQNAFYSISAGFYSIILQCKEFSYPYFNLFIHSLSSIVSPVFIGDHLYISPINCCIIKYYMLLKALFIQSLIPYPTPTPPSPTLPSNYLLDVFQHLLLPLYSFMRLFVYSFDVIHTIAFYALGIKIDAIPGRINSTTTLRLLGKGEYRGKCFELCGQGHLSMMIVSLVYWCITFNDRQYFWW